MHTNPAGVALYVTTPDLARRLQAAMPDVPVACAASLAELARLLQDVRWRAVAVEIAALGASVDEWARRLSALFPDVPLIAIGGAAEERAVAPLIALGCFHRFLRTGASAARMRTCFDAALGPRTAGRAAACGRTAGSAAGGADRHPGGAAVAASTRASGRTTGTDPRRVVLAGGLATAVVALAFGTWLLVGALEGPAVESQPNELAPHDARATEPQRAPAAERLQRTTGAATQAAVAAQSSGPASARAHVNSTAPGALAAAAAYADAPTAADGVQWLTAAEDAYARGRYAEADASLAAAAAVLGADPAVPALRERIAVARARAAGRRDAWEAMAREWTRPVPPDDRVAGLPGG